MFAWHKPSPGWDTQRLLSLVCLHSPDLECGSRKSRSPRSSVATELQVNLGHRRAYPIFYNSSLWPLVSADHSLGKAVKLCLYKNTYPSPWQIKMGYWICVFVLLCSGLFKLKCELGWLQNSASTCFCEAYLYPVIADSASQTPQKPRLRLPHTLRGPRWGSGSLTSTEMVHWDHGNF